MKFDVDQQVWMCAAEPDDTARPILRYAQVQRLTDTAGTIGCTNGFVLAVIPCKLEAGELTGLVRADALKFAAAVRKSKSWRNRNPDRLITVYLEAERITTHPLVDEFPRWHDEADKLGHFPNLGGVVNREYTDRPIRVSRPWAFFPKQAALLAAAMGHEYVHLFCAEGRDIYVDAAYRHADGDLKPPYGGLMGANVK